MIKLLSLELVHITQNVACLIGFFLLWPNLATSVQFLSKFIPEFKRLTKDDAHLNNLPLVLNTVIKTLSKSSIPDIVCVKEFSTSSSTSATGARVLFHINFSSQYHCHGPGSYMPPTITRFALLCKYFLIF